MVQNVTGYQANGRNLLHKLLSFPILSEQSHISATAMIDTHSHIYLPQFSEDIADVLDRAWMAGITNIMMPAIDFGSLEQMKAIHHHHIRFHKMAGIHPCDIEKTRVGGWAGNADSIHPSDIEKSRSEKKPGNIKDLHPSDRDTFRVDLEERLYFLGSREDIIAIGETGLDYYWSKDLIEAQRDSLRIHCRVAKELGKPVVLHNRDSTEDLLDIIQEQQDGGLNGIWHCFNGTESQGLRALDLGLYLGIGGVVTFKNAGVDRIVAKMPLDRLVLETDAPYLAPVPKRGKRNEPSYMNYTAQKLSELFDISQSETGHITTQNARRIFCLPVPG